jgi:PIN domain nuclease of toxin-antitoxin system
MKFLLDSHLLVWLIGASHKLPSQVRNVAQDPANAMFFSSASIWELANQVRIWQDRPRTSAAETG